MLPGLPFAEARPPLDSGAPRPPWPPEFGRRRAAVQHPACGGPARCQGPDGGCAGGLGGASALGLRGLVPRSKPAGCGAGEDMAHPPTGFVGSSPATCFHEIACCKAAALRAAPITARGDGP